MTKNQSQSKNNNIQNIHTQSNQIVNDLIDELFLLFISSMIQFKYRSLVRQIKFKTSQVDDRMTNWLQGLFNIKHQIVGFKTSDNKYYDVESFYAQRQKFYGEQIEILQSSDNLEISFTSENLNSSSFIRPSQPNTSEIAQKANSSFDGQDFLKIGQQIKIITELKSFEWKHLQDGKDINILYDISPCYKKEVMENAVQIINSLNSSFKVNQYLYLNNKLNNKNSYIKVFVGKTLVFSFLFTRQYKTILKKMIANYPKSKIYADRQQRYQSQIKGHHQQFQDQAPSFTTYHLAQRINQEACLDYLMRMLRQKSLRQFEYIKLLERCEQNYSQFYRVFCEGMMDNDYQNFKNEILHKVQNNLEILLSNVDQMDLSRPISRQEQRKNLKKQSELQIVKMENYFEVIEGLRDLLDHQTIQALSNYLLNQNQEIYSLISKLLAREINRNQLAEKLTIFLTEQQNNKRPHSRCVARPTKNNNRQTQNAQTNHQQQSDSLQPPMFGPSKDSNFSPIKYMSDIESNYKQAWNKLQSKAEQFSAEQYGLLYHYLQNRDDSISNFIQQLEWKQEKSYENLKNWLNNKINQILREQLSERQITILQELRHNPEVQCIYENFRYESDLTTFIQSLKDYLTKNSHYDARILHKKSSDSQLISKKTRYGKRKYSDQNQKKYNQRSPKQSQISLYQRTSQPLDNLLFDHPWNSQFEEMLNYCNFTQEKKQQYLREAFKNLNPAIFTCIRNFMKNRNHIVNIDEIKRNITVPEHESRLITDALPIFNELLKCFVEDGLLTDRIRKWLFIQFFQSNQYVLGCFQVYLETKNQQQFIENLKLIYQKQSQEMQFYTNYLKRLEIMLKQIAIQDETSAQIFQLYPDKIKAICQVYYLTGDVSDLLDTLHLMHTIHTNNKKITFATINFSGINLSPFQYDDGSEQTKQLNKICKQTIKQIFGDITIFNIGKIDKDLIYQRRSIWYRKQIDMIDGKLLNRQQFNQIWLKNFKEHVEEGKFSEQHIKNACDLDYVNYISLIKYLYKDQNYQDVKNLDPNIFNEYLQKKFQDPGSLLDRKRTLLLGYFFKNDIDVLFIQQAKNVEWKDALPNHFYLVHNGDSVIIANKRKVGNPKNSLMKIYKEQLDFNNDSACLFTDHNYLFVSGHLSSSKINIQQAKQMFQALDLILEDHPMLKIVVGIDANHYLSRANQKYFIVPTKKDQEADQDNFTSIKKRTYLQAQLSKAGINVKQIKDQLLSNRRIDEYYVEDVNGEHKQQYIPNHSHPYDHYIVRGNFK